VQAVSVIRAVTVRNIQLCYIYSTLSWLRVGQPRKRSSIIGSSKRSFSFAKGSGWFWDPHSHGAPFPWK